MTTRLLEFMKLEVESVKQGQVAIRSLGQERRIVEKGYGDYTGHSNCQQQMGRKKRQKVKLGNRDHSF